MSGEERAKNEIKEDYWVFPYSRNTDRNASLLMKYNQSSNDKIVAVKELSFDNENDIIYDFVIDSKWQISRPFVIRYTSSYILYCT